MASYYRYQTKGGARWGVRWRVRNPRPGEPRQPSRGAFLTRRDARDWHEHHIAGRPGRASSAMPTGDYLERWLTGRIALRELAANTGASYHHAIASLSGAIGHIRLRDLRADDVRDWQAANTHLAPATLATYQAVLSAALNQAVDDELLYANPAQRVKAPRNALQSAYWDSDAILAFLAGTAGDLDALPYRLMLYTGLRPGEMLALTWAALDLGGRAIALTAHIVYERGTPMIGPGTKGRPDGRTIALPAQAAGELRAWRPECLERRMAAPVWHDHDLIFPRVSGDGKPAGYSATIKRLDRYAAALGLPRITPHDLRHSWATWMAELRVPEVYVQEVLGHASPAMTRRYQHASETLSRHAAAQIDAALAGGRASTVRRG